MKKFEEFFLKSFFLLKRLLVPEEDDSSSDSDSNDYDGRENMHGKKTNATSKVKGAWGAPLSKDWNRLGFVSPASYQDKCSSCYAFASASLIESHTAIKYNKPNGVVRLSAQQIIDCSATAGNNGCKGGFLPDTFEYIQRAGGLDSNRSYPYNDRVNSCHFMKPDVAAKIYGYHRLPNNENLVRDFVGNEGPVAVAIQACSSLAHYAGGIYDDPTCGYPNVIFNHAVLITGYGSENEEISGYSRTATELIGVNTDSSELREANIQLDWAPIPTMLTFETLSMSN